MNIDSSKIELKINCFREISKPGYCFLAEAYAVFIEPPSSHLQKQPPQVFCKKKCVLRNFAKFTGKRLCKRLFLILFLKLFIKKVSMAQVFSSE